MSSTQNSTTGATPIRSARRRTTPSILIRLWPVFASPISILAFPSDPENPAPTKPYSLPSRTSSPVVLARGESPVAATATASSRFVFPAPFGPCNTTTPAGSESAICR